MEPIEQWKKEFEDAIKPHFKVDSPQFNSKARNGDYFYSHMNLAWTAFCIAKRSQPVVELPEPRSIDCSTLNNCFHVNYYSQYSIHQALDDAGIQYRIKGE